MTYTVANLFLIKKEKAAFRNLVKWITDEELPSEVTLAKALSSVMTHILIEMEGSKTLEESKEKADGYMLFEWDGLYSDCIYASKSVEAILKRVKWLVEDV